MATCGADLPLDGWPLLSAVLRWLAEDRSASSQDGLKLDSVLCRFRECTPVSEQQVERYLNALAQLEMHSQESSKSDPSHPRRAYDAAFRRLASSSVTDFAACIGEVWVPTATGQWRLGREVTFNCEGVRGDFLLDPDLSGILPEPDKRSAAGNISGSKRPLATDTHWSEKDCAESMKWFLARAAAHAPPDALATFVASISRSKPYRNLIHDVIGLPQATIDRIFARLDEADRAIEEKSTDLARRELPRLRKATRIKFKLVSGGSLVVRALNGAEITVPTADACRFQISGNTHDRQFLSEIGHPEQGTISAGHLMIVEGPGQVDKEWLRDALSELLTKSLCYPRNWQEAFLAELEAAFAVDQSNEADASARLEDRLPQILAELKPPPGSALRKALDDYERTEQALPPDRRAGALLKAKRDLWREVASTGAGDLLVLIREGIGRYGYGPARILFEPFQNADDAALQHPPDGTPSCRIDWVKGRPHVTHWGRLINQLGTDPAEGERRGWQRDLFNMLLMNLSEKRAEVTGRFGLGFKSVHLIAREVGIASGFVACRIRGGMLPEVWDEGRAISLEHAREGRRARVIELEIDSDRAEAARAAQEAFAGAARWLPATAQAIREIVLDGQRHAARFTESGAPGIRHVAFEGVAPGHALALSLDPDTTLFLPLGPDGPEALAEGVPRLWLLAPLEEECQAGWLLNSYAFRVDPGRGRLAGDSAGRKALFEGLGRALGDRLVALHDRLETDWAGFAAAAGLADRAPETGRATFCEGLVRFFAPDLARDGRDDRLETHLHRNGGLRRLVAARPALPTGLPAPFAPFLRADRVRRQVTGPLAEPARLQRLAGWSVLAEIAETSVSAEAAALLARLGFDPPPAFGPAGLLRGELRRNQGRADLATAARLGALLDDDLEEALPWTEWQNLGQAAAGALFRMANGNWRKAHLPPRTAAEADEEERRILAFAPDAAVADAGYSGTALAF